MGAAYGQGEQVPADRIADAVKKVTEGNFGLVHVEEIARGNALQAIPALKQQFLHSQDARTKSKIADALVRLGDKEQIYWDFLVKEASDAVESDIPFPREFDPQGKMLSDHFSAAFLQWAKDHDLSPSDAGEKAIYELPGKLLFLAETGDSRGLPLLRRAMSSSNYMIQAVAAKGLAKLKDKDSIPLIVAACQKSSWAASAVGQALVYFDDPEAQSAAETYLPKALFKALRETRHEPRNDPFAQ
jgi:HEAT repeat protein